MANDIAKAIDSLPGWVIPASVGGVVLVALFSQKGSKGHAYNTVVYGPQPSDPGLVSLASREVEAKQSVIQTLISAMTTRDIAGIQSERDISLMGINASVANERTRAAEAVGLADSYNRTRSIIAQVAGASHIADSQGATAKYVAKQQTKQGIVNTIGGIIRTAIPFL